MWVIDQMVRALTGCAVITGTAAGGPYDGQPREHKAPGESAEYRSFTSGGDWDEGIAP